MEQWILFLGRFHPLLTHLPIGILVALVVLECVRPFRRDSSSMAELVLLILVFVGGLLSVATGLMLEREGGYSEERLRIHMLLGIGMTIVIGVALWLKILELKRGEFTLPYRLSIGMGTLLMIAGSHQGGVLTHGRNFLTEHLPFKDNSSAEDPPLASDIPASGENISYRLHIAPLLEAHCTECHNADKMKADLRLDSYQAIMKGSKWGAVVIPGNPEDSSLYYMTTFPEGDPDRMPKDGDALPPEKILLIKDWIAQGAPSE